MGIITIFRLSGTSLAVLDCDMATAASRRTGVTSLDEERMRELYPLHRAHAGNGASGAFWRADCQHPQRASG